MPDFHEDPAGNLIVLFRVVFPDDTVVLPQEAYGLFRRTRDTDEDITSLAFRPALYTERVWLQEILGEEKKEQTKFRV